MSTINHSTRDVSIAAGRVASLVTSVETAYSPTDLPYREARSVMGQLLALARSLKVVVDPNVVGAFDNDTLDGRLVVDATEAGTSAAGGVIVSFFDPYDRMHRWHVFAPDTDLREPVRVYVERPSPASPFSRGLYLRIVRGCATGGSPQRAAS